jgi:hypothetical protein
MQASSFRNYDLSSPSHATEIAPFLIMRTFAIAGYLCCLAIGVPALAQGCKFDRSTKAPSVGGHMVVEFTGPTLKNLRGNVIDPAEDPIPQALVIVERIARGRAEYIGHQYTDLKGRFCFANLRRGTYVVKTGASGFNATETTIRIEPSKRSIGRRRLVVKQPIGT